MGLTLPGRKSAGQGNLVVGRLPLRDPEKVQAECSTRFAKVKSHGIAQVCGNVLSHVSTQVKEAKNLPLRNSVAHRTKNRAKPCDGVRWNFKKSSRRVE